MRTSARARIVGIRWRDAGDCLETAQAHRYVLVVFCADTQQLGFCLLGAFPFPFGAFPFLLGVEPPQFGLLLGLQNQLLRFRVLLAQFYVLGRGFVRASFVFFSAVIPQKSEYQSESSQETAGEYCRDSRRPAEMQNQRLHPDQSGRDSEVTDDCQQV